MTAAVAWSETHQHTVRLRIIVPLLPVVRRQYGLSIQPDMTVLPDSATNAWSQYRVQIS